MTGLTGGVPTLFKNEQPCLQAIHCYAHRLERAYKDALKKLTLYGTSSNPLLNLYLSYHHLPLNRRNLKTTFQTLSLPLVLSKLDLLFSIPGLTNFLGLLPRLLHHQLPQHLTSTQDSSLEGDTPCSSPCLAPCLL